MNGVDKVILIGNYENDGQVSMQKFAETLYTAFERRNISVEIIKPQPRFAGKHRKPVGFGKWLGYIDKFFVFPGYLKSELSRLGISPDDRVIIHICDHSNAIYTKYLKDYPHLVTCHDLMAIRSAHGDFPQNRTRLTGRLLQGMILRGLRRAKFVACVSENTKRDLVALDAARADRCITIPSGLNYPYGRIDKEAALKQLARFNLPENRPIIFNVSNNSWYKNRDGLLSVFQKVTQEISADVPILVLGGACLSASQKKFVRDNGLKDAVYELGHVSGEELGALYSLANVFLFPSFYEGFGWPPLEAQACGCPVVATTGGALREVLLNSALTADPADFDALAQHTVSVLQSQQVSEDLVSRGYRNVKRFDLEEMVQKYIMAYEEVLDLYS